ncbi:MAG TPA: PAS domain-containing protein [Motiliproteus sp.]
MDYRSRCLQPLTSAELRQKAKQLAGMSHSQFSRYSPGKGLEMLHELQLHQIELELQNQSLIEARDEVQHLYQRLFHGAPIAYLNCDDQGNIVDCNDRAEWLLGRSREMLCGSRFSQYLSLEMADRLYVFERNSERSPSTVRQIELTFDSPDGTSRRVLAQIRDLPASDFSPPMKLIALVDLSQLP